MQSEAQTTGLDWNGLGVMGNTTTKQSTVDGRVVVWGYKMDKRDPYPGMDYYRVWINAGYDAANFTPDEVDEIGVDYISDPEASRPDMRGWDHHTGKHYDLHYVGVFLSFAEACKAGAEMRADLAEEWGE